MSWIKIHKPGFFSTIQDNGIYGYKKYGIPQSGSLDYVSYSISNYLSFSERDNPVFEFTLDGPTIEFGFDTYIGITGASMNPKINNSPVEMYKTIIVKKGDILSFSQAEKGARTYLSVYGDLKLNKFLDSYSTNTVAKYGGYKGRQFLSGDILNFDQKKNLKNLKYRSIKKNTIDYLYRNMDILRFIEGPEYKFFPKDSIENFNNSKYEVSKKFNRMGIRFEGNKINSEISNITSSAVIPGIIQVPGDKKPILLLADSQTTGGYPRIGKVIFADLYKAAQYKRGDIVNFREISFFKAERLSDKLNKLLKKFV